MKSIICPFDAKSGVLCSKCESRLESGSITREDVEAAIKLARLADRNHDFDKFTLVGGSRVDEDFVLVLRNPDLTALKSNSMLADQIKDEFGRNVWFVDSEASDRLFIEGLLYPLKVLSVNLIWLPDGNKLTKIIVADGGNKKRIGLEKVQKIAKTVRNIELLVEFENR